MSKATKQHEAAWKVWGRGASKTFTAATPAKTASSGDRVKLVSKAGVVTTGTLSELHKSEDGLDFWTVDRDAKTPDQRAADRALKYEAQAEYWASDKGAETAKRIAERAARKAAAAGNEETSEETSSEETSEPAAEVSPAAAKLAALIAAGIDPATAAAALKLAAGNVTVTPAKTPAKSTSTSTSTKSKAGKAGDCAACKRTSVMLVNHPAGHAVCNYCKSADVETITRRVARKAGK